MTFKSALYSAAVLPLLDGSSYAGLRGNLKKGAELERRPLAQNLDSQWHKTQAMLHHAYRTVPFYTKRFDEAGIRPADIRTPEDLQIIPVLTREDIRNNFEQLVSRAFDRGTLLQAATGGTTDSPVPMLRDPKVIALRNAIEYQFKGWADIKPGDRVFWLWGARTDFAENPSWKWRLYDEMICGRVWCPTSILNEQVLAGYARRMDAFRPHAITAYPTPLAEFCRYLLDSGYKGHLPKTAVCTAEPLVPEQREVIERALGCRAFELYGARDFGFVAGECEQHDGLHLNPFTIFAELIPIEGSSGVHEIIATELLNPAFPMIRYRINDCVVPRAPECACGRGFPLIGTIEGRVTDNFYLPNGDVVPGVSLTNRVIKVASGIRKIQVIQEERARFTVKFVPETDFTPGSLSALRSMFQKFLSDQVQIEFMQVDEIPRERSGKTRLCICKIQPPHRTSNR